MSFCEVLKELRIIKGATQKDVATACALTPTCICQLETGARNPTGSTVAALAIYFGVSADYLLGLEDDFGTPSATPMHDTALSSDERKLLSVYHSLSPEMRTTLWSLLATWSPTGNLSPSKKQHD